MLKPDTKWLEKLPESVGLSMLGEELGSDVRASLEVGLSGGAAIGGPNDPEELFRGAVSRAISAIEARGVLLHRFLSTDAEVEGDKGPLGVGVQRLTLADTRKAITFIYSHMVNCFKGELAELLAVGACMGLMEELKDQGILTRQAILYVGDVARAERIGKTGKAKGADLHLLELDDSGKIRLLGVGEVKSYHQSTPKLQKQLDQHVQRAQRGLVVAGVPYPPGRIVVGGRDGKEVQRFSITPAAWKLSRGFHFDSEGDRSWLVNDETPIPLSEPIVRRTGPAEWHITLRWSKEALDSIAYEMTFWYMEKLGELAFIESKPAGWEEMSTGEAGRNAVKMRLYYALLNLTGAYEQRAVALYNTYGFGYSLGMNFRNPDGRREMLWPEDLREIAAGGQNKNGCRVWD